eukprot:9500924-Pyramimonas_sp.AAC.7
MASAPSAMAAAAGAAAPAGQPQGGREAAAANPVECVILKSQRGANKLAVAGRAPPRCLPACLLHSLHSIACDPRYSSNHLAPPSEPPSTTTTTARTVTTEQTDQNDNDDDHNDHDDDDDDHHHHHDDATTTTTTTGATAEATTTTATTATTTTTSTIHFRAKVFGPKTLFKFLQENALQVSLRSPGAPPLSSPVSRRQRGAGIEGVGSSR